MGNKLFSKNYKNFIKGIGYKDNNFKDILSYAKESMGPIAEELHIGRLESIVTAKPNPVERVGFNGREVLYQAKEGYDPNLHTMEFHTGGGVTIVMNAYPAKGYEWDEDDKDDLQFICANFFALLERARMRTILNNAAFTESMTGALNINGIIRTGMEMMKRGVLTDYTVAFFNIKNFKFLNGRYGIDRGNMVLRGLVDKIIGFFIPDEQIARLGGDNFVALIRNERVDIFLDYINPMTFEITGGVNTGFNRRPDDVPESAGNSTMTHLTAVTEEEPVDESSNTHKIEISFRVGLYKMQPDEDAGAGVTKANTALRETRKEGNPDVVWFTDDLLDHEMNTKKSMFMFNRALQEREFVVYYQPKVSLDDGKLCGCEALVRWVQDGKVIPPMTFIPALEHDGNICELDMYVFETVCRDIRAWLDAGVEPVKVSTNFSRFHIKDEDFAAKILTIVDRYNVDPQYIEVELTEAACYEDADKLTRFLSAMRERGIIVSIDDFGTGYSSLSLLKDLMVDVIKLDQSFIHGIESDDEERANNDKVVIKNIINMVDELNMKIIAEGVESGKAAEFLKNAHCDMAQGYLYDRPMPHTEFDILLRGARLYND
ncbi:EAL domain, c-di-GMP-specific phosphodiesterase class I (or its enzymatically inactive variant) [Lachnospiraceae bacterium NE2001]|nr:EAL domain, c-di-GMP-specific phosphodiesterase class I (or its enzymatically inactive variant) [Lachnospiraceae bacterium NE2001]